MRLSCGSQTYRKTGRQVPITTQETAQVRKIVSAALGLALCGASASAQDKDWKKSLTDSLRHRYPLTKMDKGLFAEKAQIKGSTGIELIVQQRGLISQDNPTAVVTRRTRVRNGQLVNAQSDAGPGSYIYKIGEHVYVREIDVDDDEITFRVLTVESIDRLVGGRDPEKGQNASARYFATVSFQFDKGYLPAAPVDDVVKAIGTVFATSEQVTAAKTIELGQTVEQVEAILGKPETVAKLGTKTIYTYKTMKVVFLDGKVSDVQ